MSSAARFLLEFEATGDQEVVSKIKAVGEAGKQTATDLESLRGIEDPFEPIATGADAAVAPIEGVGTAAEEAVTPIEGLGTASESAVTPLTDMGGATEELGGIFSGAGTEAETFSGALGSMNDSAQAVEGGITPAAPDAMGNFGESASTSADQSAGFGDTVQGMSGSIVAIGGAIGGAVSAFFRYQDAQLKVQKAQNAVARANEAVRKTTENIQAILVTATSNTDAIAAANTRYVAAQARVNQLQREGITSGEEYNAANKELQDSQAALSAELAKGGGDAKKLTDEMNKLELQEGKAATAAGTLDKANRQSNQTIMESILQYATLAGSVVQIGQGMGKFGGVIGKLKFALTDLNGALKIMTGVGLAGFTAALGIGAAAVGVFMGAVLALSKAPYDLIIGKLDQMGKKIGETIPALSAALQSTGDAFRSSLSFLAKGTTDTIKALTGLDFESKIVGKSFSDLVQEFMKLGTTGVPEVDAALQSFIETSRKAGLTDKEIIELAKQHNDEFEKVAASTNKAAQVTATLTSRFGEQGRAIQENMQMSEGQAAALEKVTGSAHTTATAVGLETGAITQLNAESVKSITALQEQTRAQILANAGFNNAKVATLQYQEALTTMTQSLVDDTDQKNANAQATLTLANSNLNAQNTAATLREEYANSVDALADFSTTMDNAELSSMALQTALNEQLAALQEEEMELRASIAATDDKVIAQQELENAYLRGVVSVDEWRTGLASAAAEEQGAIDRLADFGTTFSDLPGYMEPTVESLQTFAEAAAGSGEAAQAMADQASEAFQTMAGDAQKIIDDLSGTLLEGGEKLQENWDKAWVKIPEGVKKHMSTAQQEELKGIAEMEAAAQQSVIELGIDLKTEDFATARADFTSNLKALASESDGIWSQMWSRAAELASTGSEAMVARVSEIVKSGDSPQIMLQQLEAAAKQFGPIGDSMGTNLMNGVGQSVSAGGATLQTRFGEGLRGLPPKAGTAGGQAGAAFVSEWDANVQLAGNALQSIVKTASTLKVEIPVTADVQQAGAALASIQKTGSTLKVQIPVTADVSKAHQAIASLVTARKPVVIPVTYSVPKAPKIAALTGKITYTNVVPKPPKPPNINLKIIYKNVVPRPPNPPNINKKIIYKNVVPSPPRVNDIHRKIVYHRSIVGPRPAQLGMHEMVSKPTMILAGEAGPERIDITPGRNTPAVHSIGGGGGRRSTGDVIIPVTLMLDNKVLIRTVRRGLVEEVSGAM